MELSKEEREELLAQYHALRAEIVQRIDIHHKVENLALVVFGTMISIGLLKESTHYIFLIYPYFAVFIATSWSHIDLRIDDLSVFIKDHIETKLKAITWDHHYNTNIAASGTSFKSKEISIIGIFILSQIIAVVLALDSLSWNWTEIALIVLDVVSMILTYAIITQRGDLKKKNAEGV